MKARKSLFGKDLRALYTAHNIVFSKQAAGEKDVAIPACSRRDAAHPNRKQLV